MYIFAGNLIDQFFCSFKIKKPFTGLNFKGGPRFYEIYQLLTLTNGHEPVHRCK